MKDHQKPIMLSLIDHVIGEVSKAEVFHVFMCVQAQAWRRKAFLWDSPYDSDDCLDIYDTFIQQVERLFPEGVSHHDGLQFALAVTHPDPTDVAYMITGNPVATGTRTNAFRLEWLGKLRKQYE